MTMNDSESLFRRDQVLAAKPFDKATFAATFTHHTVHIDDSIMHYVSGGSGNPVVLLHGWPETWYAWHRVMPMLVGNYTVVAPDLPGLGNSSASKSYDKKTVASLVHQLVSGLGHQQILLVGHDMGANVAYAYAALYPHEVRKLVYMEASIPGFGLEEVMNFARTGLWHFGFHATPDVAVPLVSGRERFYLTYLTAPHISNPEALRESLEEYVRAYSQPDVLRAGFEYYAALLQDGKDNRAMFKQKLPMPVLGVIAGSLNAALFDSLRSVASDVRSLIVEQSGHFIHEERPIFLTEQLLAFFEG